MSTKRFIILALLVGFVSVGLTRAQQERGTLASTITDATGAIIPGVDVTVTNVDTGVSFKTSSNDQGEFVAPNLIPGRYRVVATHEGFKTLTREDIIIRANDRLAVAITMEPGTVTEKVEVRGDVAPLIEKESATLSSVFEAQQVSELPTLDRSMFNIADLGAGMNHNTTNNQSNNAAIPDNGRAAEGLNANGLGDAAVNSFFLDGVNNTDASATSSVPMLLPPLEAIEEFRLETSNGAPELSRGATGVFVTLKSGTNKLHGALFEFLRNSSLDARNFFDDEAAAGSKKRIAPFKQNQFGGTLGGPIVKDRTFFFMDYQGFRQRQGLSSVAFVPGAAIRSGDFSGTSQPIYDPATYNPTAVTRQQFTGNKINPYRFSSAAKAILQYVPLPNDPTGAITPLGFGNYYSQPSLARDQDSFDVKIDDRISDKDTFGARFSWGRSNAFLPGAFSNTPQYAPAQGTVAATGQNGFLQGNVSQPSDNAALDWIRNFTPTTLNEFRVAWLRGGPDATQLGYGKDYANVLGIPNINPQIYSSGFPGIYVTGMTALGEAGAYPEVNIENAYQILDNFTLIRGAHTFKMGVDLRYLRQNFIQLLNSDAGGTFSFGQDFTSDPNNPGTTGNGFASYLLGIADSASIGTLTGDANLIHSEIGMYWQDVWKITHKLTFTYGLRYDILQSYREGRNHMSNFDPVGGVMVLPNQGGPSSNSSPCLKSAPMVCTHYNDFGPRLGLVYQITPRLVVRSGFGLYSAIPVGKVFGFMSLNTPFSGGYNYYNTSVPQQVVRTLDQGFPATTPVQPLNDPIGLVIANNPKGPKGYLAQRSLGVQYQIASNTAVEVNYNGYDAAYLLQSYNLDQPVLGNGNFYQREPYYKTVPNVTYIWYFDPRYDQNYNAMQAIFTQRVSHGLTLGANYTWSHALETYPAQDQVGVVYNNTELQVPNRFAANWLYELPFGRGKRLGGNMNPILDNAVGGWRFSGVLGFQSGTPYTVTDVYGYNANRSCNGQTPPGGHTVNEWFDVSCFSIPTPVPDKVYGGTYIPYGNSGYNILYSDGTRQVDFSMTKFFPLPREGHKIEFRAEGFNVFNNTQLGIPNATIGTGNVGAVTSAQPAREIQLALKYSF